MPPTGPKPADDATLIAAAEKALAQAYARYSGFRVGAALLTANGNVFAGCNVESVAYPLGHCAERNAISAAVLGEGPEMRVARLALAATLHGEPAPCTPCGACRQVILEWGPEAVLVFFDASRQIVRVPAGDLLPRRFGFEAKTSD
jgi:cytidine deaminase